MGSKEGITEVTKDGAYSRKESQFRRSVKADGSSEFTPEAGRYHLIISYACPWASRTNAVRMLKGLEEAIPVTVVHPVFQRTRPEDDNDNHHGWFFNENDKYMGVNTVRDFYDKYSTGDVSRYSVPILFDTKTEQIVNNESAEIVRMFNTEFNNIAKNPDVDLYPEQYQHDIDEVNSWIYPRINNGVYAAGFAQSQEAYDVAVELLFEGLDLVEQILSTHRYITDSNTITEADIRLFKTLVRFDEVYATHFKCNKKRVADYPNMENYVREIYQIPEITGTVNMDHIKRHYYCSHPSVNKFGIIAVGPGVDYSQAHDRDEKFPLK